MCRTVLQEEQVLLSRVVALLPIIVQLQHGRHIASRALLVLPVSQTASNLRLLCPELLLFEFLEIDGQAFLLLVHFEVLLVLIRLDASGSGKLVVEATDESSHDLERGADIVVDVCVGRVEADDPKIVDSLVVEQEQSGQSHETKDRTMGTWQFWCVCP